MGFQFKTHRDTSGRGGLDLEASALACACLLLHRGDLQNLVFDRVLREGMRRVQKGDEKVCREVDSPWGKSDR